MKLTEHLLKLARIHQKELALREEAKRLKEQMRSAGVVGCYYGFEGGDIGMEILLADYLTLWPDAQPQVKTASPESDGTIKTWFEYPFKSIGTGLNGKTIWVNASTPMLALPTLNLPSRETVADGVKEAA